MAEQFGLNDPAPSQAFGVDDPTPDQASYHTTDYIAGTAGGFNEGLLNMLGFPVDAANAVLSVIGLDSDKPVGGSKWLRDQVPNEFFPPSPDNPAGRFSRRVGQELGAAALPAMGAIKAAKSVSDVVRMGVMPSQRATALGRATENALAPIARSPGKFAALEATSALGSGVGAGVAQEFAPGNPWAEIAGQVVGGMAPTALTVGPTGLAVRAGRSAWSRFSPKAQARAGMREAQDVIGKELTDSARQSLGEADRLRERAPGFNPTLGEATGSPSLLAQQRALESQVSGADLEALAQRYAESVGGVEGFRQSAGPGGQGRPEMVLDAATGELYALRQGMTDQLAGTQAQREALAGRVPKGDLYAQGNVMRESIEGARLQTKARMSALANHLGINDADLTVPFKAVQRDLLNIAQPPTGSGRFKPDPAKVPAIVSRLRAAKAWNLEDVKVLREEIGDELRSVLSGKEYKTGDQAKARALVQMRARIDQYLDTAAASPALADSPAAQKFLQNYATFRRAYKSEYIDVYETPFSRKARAGDQTGDYVSAPEKVAQLFWRPEAQGGVTAAQEYKAMVGSDPAASAALEATILDSLHAAAVRQGVIDPKSFEGWLKRYGKVLEQFPGIRQNVENIGAANASLLAREAELGARSAALENLKLTKLFDAYTSGAVTADEAIRKALQNPREMAELYAYARKDPETLNALKRSVWDIVTEGDATAIALATERYRGSLSQLFSKEHMQDLQDLMSMHVMMERSGAPQGAAVVPRPFAALEEKIGQGIPQLSSRMFAFQSGRVQKGYLIVDTLMRGLRGRRQAAMKKAMFGALYDPEVAKEMRALYAAEDLSKLGAQRIIERLGGKVMRRGGPFLLRILAGQTGQAEGQPLPQ